MQILYQHSVTYVISNEQRHQQRQQLSSWVHAGSLEVGKLKLLCQRLFKVPAARQALFLKAGGENPMPDNIGEDDSKDLMFFSIEVDHAASSAASAAVVLALCLLSQRGDA